MELQQPAFSTKPSKMAFIITHLSGKAEAWTFIHVLIYQIEEQLAFLEAAYDLEAAFAVVIHTDACLMEGQDQICNSSTHPEGAVS